MANIGQERDQDTVTYAGFTGLRNNIASERFAVTDLETAVNVDLDNSGRLARRAGYTSVVASPQTHSVWSDENETVCLYVSDGVLYRMSTDYTSVALRGGMGAFPVSYAKVTDLVYFSSAVANGVYDIQMGAVRNWGITPPTAIGITPTVGVLAGGTYQVTMTYLAADGRESGAGLAQEVFVSDGASLILILPVSLDPQVVAKVVYVTTQNGDMLYELTTVPNATTNVTYNGGSLSRPLEMQHLRETPGGQMIASYRGRMFVASGDALYPSIPFGYELFDLRQYIQLDSRITLLAPLVDKESADVAQNSGFFIGTERSCGVLVGSSPEDFQYVPKLSLGAIPGSMAMVDGSLFADGSSTARLIPLWITQRGICAGLPNMQIQNLTRSKYDFSAGGQGAALFRHEQSRYIVNFNL